ncbi:MAG: imidazole glycerol phosphate synthase subunit HisH [Actinobacteria bacterium]|nr:imidazole glycerol phosphate synthase subunit HisH [Actinomycetota bacterium]MSY97450.1 imidazole glycerol phosphate synthase subunit HisH [Actinomycetota bacterium]
MREIVILDYGSGNLRSAQRALERVGATVTVTSDFDTAVNADALVVPGVGAFAACMRGILEIQGDQIIDTRITGGRPVLGICVGMQVLFAKGDEHGTEVAGLGQWPGVVEQLEAQILPHMGWDTVRAPASSKIFDGLAEERFYFVHSFGVKKWQPNENTLNRQPPVVTWCTHGTDFVAAVEDGPLVATQFHPEKSGDAGLTLLHSWVKSIY